MKEKGVPKKKPQGLVKRGSPEQKKKEKIYNCCKHSPHLAAEWLKNKVGGGGGGGGGNGVAVTRSRP